MRLVLSESFSIQISLIRNLLVFDLIRYRQNSDLQVNEAESLISIERPEANIKFPEEKFENCSDKGY